MILVTILDHHGQLIFAVAVANSVAYAVQDEKDLTQISLPAWTSHPVLPGNTDDGGLGDYDAGNLQLLMAL